MSGSFDAGSVIARIKADLTEFQEGLKRAKGAMQNMTDKMSKEWESLNKSVENHAKGIQSITVAATAMSAAGVLLMRDWVKNYEEAARTQAQLESVLKSTRGAARLTAAEVNALASKYQSLTAISDDAVRAGQNMLLTFTGIKKEAFEPATAALLDMATAMNGGITPSAQQLEQQAIQLGKALNDPTKGIAALSRNGVLFTEQQANMIRTLQASGDMLGAQRVILAELSKEYGGSAAKQLETFTGKWQNLMNRFGDIKERLGQALIPALDAIARALSRVMDYIESLSPETISLVAKITLLVTAVSAGAGALSGFLLILPKIKAGFMAVSAAVMAVNPVLLAVAAVVGTFGALVLKKTNDIAVAWDRTTQSIQADVQAQSDTWNAWNMAAAKLAGNEQKYAELRAKAQYYILQSTLYTESQIAAIRSGASQEQLDAIQANIDGNNKWAKEAANAAIEFAQTHTVNMPKVQSALKAVSVSYGEVAEASGKTAEESAKNAQQELENRQKVLKEFQKFKIGINDVLENVRAEHKESMESLGKDLLGLRSKLAEVKNRYLKDIGDIQEDLKKRLGDMASESQNRVIEIRLRFTKEIESTKATANRSIAEKFVKEEEEIAELKKQVAEATNFADKKAAEDALNAKLAIYEIDKQAVIGLEAEIAEVKRFNALTEIQQIQEVAFSRVASLQAQRDAEILSEQESYNARKVQAEREAKEQEKRRTADYIAEKLKIMKEIGDLEKRANDEITLYQAKEKAIIDLRNKAVAVYAEQLIEMNRATDRSVNAMIERFDALNKAIAAIGTRKKLTDFIGYSNVSIGNAGRTPNLPDLKNPLDGVKLNFSPSNISAGGGLGASSPYNLTVNITDSFVGNEQAAEDLLNAAFNRLKPKLGL